MAAAIAPIGAGSHAHADLPEDSDRLVRLWTQRGARVERLPPFFLDHGQHQIVVPAIPLAPRNTTDTCLTLAFLGVRTAEFLVGPDIQPKDLGDLFRPLPLLSQASLEKDHRTHSAGGVASLTRCNEGKDALARVALEMISAHAAVEGFLAMSDHPLGDLHDILPERGPGPVAPHGDTGGPIEPGPLGLRLVRAEGRARADGASQVTRVSLRADDAGAGEFTVQLADGCHRLEVMAEVPATIPRGPHAPTDVDAEARDATGRVLARDRGDIPDAHLAFCLGEPGTVTVPFIGASGPAAVTLLDARWAMPPHLPRHFGARASGGFAAAMARRHAPTPTEDPIFESLGIQGSTTFRVEVQAGRCYFAAMALTRGESRAMRLSATLGEQIRHHDAGSGLAESVGFAFCAEATALATFEADVRGNSPWWALSIWPMGSGMP